MVQKTNSKHYSYNKSSYSVNKIAIVGAIIFTVFIYIFSDKDNKTSIDTSSTYITQSGKMGSYNKESMEKLVNCSSHKDYQCIEQLMYSGEIFEIPQGQDAYVVESEFPGKVKIRLKGETQEIWTFIEAIKHK